MINLSIYNGVPTTEQVAREQFKEHIENPRRFGLFKSDGGFLVLRKITQGKYKGCWGTYWYSNKPQTPFIEIKSLNEIYNSIEVLKEL